MESYWRSPHVHGQALVASTWHNPYTATEQVSEEKDRMKRESLFSHDKVWSGKENSLE